MTLAPNTSQRDLVKLSLLLCPTKKTGKGHDAPHNPADERGWR